ncbi:MAG: PHP domain-containing protein [Nanoarchaeota archaeon]
MKQKVFFSKPNYPLISSLDKQMVDMHFHTQFSDTNIKIKDVIKKAKKLGIGVAITDHNEIEGSIEAFNNKEGVMVIPGIEVSCIEGPHILLYFYSIDELKDFFENYLKRKKNKNPYMATKTTVSELLDECEKYNCVKVAAHPFGYSISNSGLCKCIKKAYVNQNIMDKITGLEVVNGAMNRHLNNKAIRFSNMTNKVITGGSDGHCLFQLGQTVTVTKAKNHIEFLDNLQKNKNIVIGKETKAIPKILPFSKSLKAHLGYAVPSVKIQSILLYNRAKHFKTVVVEKINNKIHKKSKIKKETKIKKLD